MESGLLQMAGGQDLRVEGTTSADEIFTIYFNSTPNLAEEFEAGKDKA